jgi:hypothetical protein
MKKIFAECVMMFFLAAITHSSIVAAPPNTILFNGKNYYINGINVPWNAFGSDVGTHYQWGSLYDATYFSTLFQECKSGGVNCVRLWIHCDGRSSPEFDDEGFVTGLDTNFLSNFDDILRIAQENNVMVMPCLWSFDMTKDFTASAGKYAGMHASLIQDTLKTRSYIDKALIPMVKHLANRCNLLAYEVINEPEWSITGPGTTVQLVSAQEMVRFCGMIAEAIHANSKTMVTVGSACLKWHSSRQPPATDFYWSDSSFNNAYNKPGAFLDFYQIHYYDWMYNADWGYDPFQSTKTPEYWKLDKPTLIGETPGIKGNYTVKQMVDMAYSNGYAGIMPWSYDSVDNFGSWSSCKTELKEFYNAHSSIIDFKCGTSPVVKKSRESIKTQVSRNGTTLLVFDIQGKIIDNNSSGELSRQIPAGNSLRLYQLRDKNNHIIGVEKRLR